MNFKERLAETTFLFSAVLCVVGTVSVFLFMLTLGLPILVGRELTSILFSGWFPQKGVYGIYPMLVGTLCVASSATLIASIVSLGVSYMIGVLKVSPISKVLRRMVEFMTAIPTVVYGFVGVFLLVPLIREISPQGSGMCVLASSIILGVLVSPTMIMVFSDSFERIPRSYLLALDSLGASKLEKFWYAILPSARKGLMVGFILGLCRALGDTLISLMLAGNAAIIPLSLFDPTRTLTSHIALTIASDYESLEFKSIYICALALYLLTTLLTLWVRKVSRHSKARQE